MSQSLFFSTSLKHIWHGKSWNFIEWTIAKHGCKLYSPQLSGFTHIYQILNRHDQIIVTLPLLSTRTNIGAFILLVFMNLIAPTLFGTGYDIFVDDLRIRIQSDPCLIDYELQSLQATINKILDWSLGHGLFKIQFHIYTW